MLPHSPDLVNPKICKGLSTSTNVSPRGNPSLGAADAGSRRSGVEVGRCSSPDSFLRLENLGIDVASMALIARADPIVILSPTSSFPSVSTADGKGRNLVGKGKSDGRKLKHSSPRQASSPDKERAAHVHPSRPASRALLPGRQLGRQAMPLRPLTQLTVRISVLCAIATGRRRGWGWEQRLSVFPPQTGLKRRKNSLGLGLAMGALEVSRQHHITQRFLRDATATSDCKRTVDQPERTGYRVLRWSFGRGTGQRDHRRPASQRQRR